MPNLHIASGPSANVAERELVRVFIEHANNSQCY